MVAMTSHGLRGRSEPMGVRDMFRTTDRGVMITVILCGTALGLGLLGMVGWLLYAGRDTAAILTLVNAILTAITYAKVRDVDSRTTRVEQQTNGHTARILDAALKDKESPS